MTKVCSKCKVEKNLEEFHKNKTMFDGHLNSCKECRNKSESIIRNNNREKVREQGRNHYNKHRKKIKKKTCRKCNQEFETSRNIRQYCELCSNTIKIFKHIHFNKCQLCDDEFMTNKSGYKFCCIDCERKYKENKKRKFCKVCGDLCEINNSFGNFFFCSTYCREKYIRKTKKRKKANKKRYKKKFRNILRRKISRQISNILKLSGSFKRLTTYEYLGCTNQEFWNYIQTIIPNNITVENYSKEGYNLDHIFPLEKFKNLSNSIEEQRIIFNYKNLQFLKHNINCHVKSDFLPIDWITRLQDLGNALNIDVSEIIPQVQANIKPNEPFWNNDKKELVYL